MSRKDSGDAYAGRRGAVSLRPLGAGFRPAAFGFLTVLFRKASRGAARR
jgi:hypothetical protein